MAATDIPISDPIILPQDFDITKLSVAADPKPMGASKARQAAVNYNGRRLVVQTPPMRCPFGMNRWAEEDKNEKFSVDLSFGASAGEAKFREMTETMDQLLVHKAMEYNQNWLRSPKNNEDAVGAMYTPMVKLSKKDPSAYPPNFKVKVPYKDGNFRCGVFNSKQERLNLNDVDIRGATVAVIMQCVGVWIVAGKFGCTWNVLQMRVKLPTVQRGFAFNTKALEDEEEEEEEDVPAKAEDEGAVNQQEQQQDADEDAGAAAAAEETENKKTSSRGGTKRGTSSAANNDKKKPDLFDSDDEDN